jgi:hypothetical protein
MMGTPQKSHAAAYWMMCAMPTVCCMERQSERQGQWGYTRFVTYTLQDESGSSLRAVGFKLDGIARYHDWNSPKGDREKTIEAEKISKVR